VNSAATEQSPAFPSCASEQGLARGHYRSNYRGSPVLSARNGMSVWNRRDLLEGRGVDISCVCEGSLAIL